MSAFAGMLGVQPPTVTKMISRLAAQDYVERRTSAGDGRQALVFLTDRGRRAVSMIDKGWKAIAKDALSEIDDRDRKKLRKLLRQVSRNLGAGEDEAEIDFAADDELADGADIVAMR